jgi:ABC-type multidrug transport system ATPase subunit
VNLIIDAINLENERKKMVKKLSGGNKRKLSLAMALISDNNFILLDEPTR